MKYLKNTFLFLISVFITMLLMELFLRFSYSKHLSVADFDDQLGKVFRKNYEYLIFNEGFGAGRINKDRFLGKDVSYKKEKNTIRVAIFGDSYIQAFQIFQRNHFINTTKKILKKEIQNINFEFLNFSQGGSNFPSQFISNSLLASKFNPDFIFYFIDVEDLYPRFGDALKPKLVLNKDSLYITNDFPSNEVALYKIGLLLTQNSALINLLNYGRDRFNRIPLGSILLGKMYTWFNNNKKEKDNYPKNFVMPKLTRKIIETLNNKQVIFINRGMEKLPYEFVDYIKEKGFKYLDLSIVLNEMLENGINPKYWKPSNRYGHWNNQAHLKIGKFLAEFIHSQFVNKDYIAVHKQNN